MSNVKNMYNKFAAVSKLRIFAAVSRLRMFAAVSALPHMFSQHA
jgi:hypothetical protein